VVGLGAKRDKAELSVSAALATWAAMQNKKSRPLRNK